MAQSDFWNKLKARLREVSIAAADFTEEQALIGKLKFDILNLKRKIEHKHNEIGVRICELSLVTRPKPKPFEDEEIIRLLGEIAEIEKLVESKREDISKVADQVRTRGSADVVEKKAEETPAKPKKKPGPKPGSKRKKPGPKPGLKRKKPGPKPGSKRKKPGPKPGAKKKVVTPETVVESPPAKDK
ncbi:MAG: hypothetical protein HQ568_12340 [Calditrichaeota bacterium]|nr:hypothetical protein [Calditrichota bacterium]